MEPSDILSNRHYRRRSYMRGRLKRIWQIPENRLVRNRKGLPQAQQSEELIKVAEKQLNTDRGSENKEEPECLQD
jgi:hypothetical protein